MSFVDQKQECIDGCNAVALACYKFIDFASIFPITPSSPMAENVEQYSAQGKKNLFGNVVTVRQAQAELGAIGACHGSGAAGGLAASFSCSQGVLLMISNLYHIAGERLPFVLHIANRTVGMAGTSLAADHTDLYSFEGTNFCCLGSCNVQESYDMAIVSHATAIKAQAAFCHFFEGYRVSHQFETLNMMTKDSDLADFLDKKALTAWRNRDALDPDRTIASNIGLGPEVHFQLLESQKFEFAAVPGICEEYFSLLKQKTGREYHCFEYTGHPEAETVIVIMGAASQTAEMVVKALVERQNMKIGCVKVRLFRPFSTSLLVKAIPQSARVVVVMDRAPELVQAGGTLYREVLAAVMKEERFALPHTSGKIELVAGGRFSVAGWELRPRDVMSVIKAYTKTADIHALPKDFCVGITDDIAHTALPRVPIAEVPADLLPAGTSECVLWGIGADGTIGACRSAMKILSDRTKCECQANFEFDGKKSGGTTISHLRFGAEKIRAQYNIEEANYIACHAQSYIGRFDMLSGAKKGAVFVLNTEHDSLEALETFLPVDVKRTIAEKELQFYAVNATKVAKSVGLGNRINTVVILFFFKYGLGKLLDFDVACNDLKESAKITYAKQKAEVIESNIRAIDTGRELIEQCRINYDRAAWLNPDASRVKTQQIFGPARDEVAKFFIAVGDRDFSEIGTKFMRQYNSGKFPSGYSKYEKLGAAAQVPVWHSEKCIQCGACSVACPHASIRTLVLNTDKMPANVPADLVTLPYTGKLPAVSEDASKLRFTIVVSPLDCRGCKLCAKICPKDALSMADTDSVMPAAQNLFDYAYDKLQFGQGAEKIDTMTCNLRELQFRFPYMEFPGSCPGCGESNIMRMLTTLFGESMIVSVGIGCSLVWMHYNLIKPFDVDGDSRGISSASSLFEDNSVYGWGIALTRESGRANIKARLETSLATIEDARLKQAAEKWLQSYDNIRESIQTSRELRSAVGIVRKADGEYYNHPIYVLPADYTRFHGADRDLAEYLTSFNVYLNKTTHWIVGGDGWAYDIDFGGVDHILASRDRVRVLIMVNHCFANTGGQKSKATPFGSVCKHAYNGVDTAEKKFGLMMMSYQDVYVAQISLGANKMQALKALREAESHNGSSVVLAYCPCISHMVSDGGLVNQERQQKLAVETGIWPIYRYNPDVEAGKRLTMDCKKPEKPVTAFIETEQRFGVLAKKNPQRYAELHAKLQHDVEEHWRALEHVN